MPVDSYGNWIPHDTEQLRAEKRKKWFIASAVVGIPLLLLLISRLLIRLRMRGEITDLERKVRKIKLEKELRDLKDKEEGS
jgi:hypothetical protein